MRWLWNYIYTWFWDLWSITNCTQILNIWTWYIFFYNWINAHCSGLPNIWPVSHSFGMTCCIYESPLVYIIRTRFLFLKLQEIYVHKINIYLIGEADLSLCKDHDKYSNASLVQVRLPAKYFFILIVANLF